MKANKKTSSFKLWLLRIVPASLIAALTMAASCKKPEDPEPTKTQVIEWSWTDGLPNKDSLKYYASQPDVKNVIMKLNDIERKSSEFGPILFKRARDSLDTRFAINREKITGEGTIYLDHPIETDDSLYFVMNGFVFARNEYKKSQSYQ